MSAKPSPLETSILEELGVPKEAKRVLILGMDAHLDYDWMITFQRHVSGTSKSHTEYAAGWDTSGDSPTEGILPTALGLLRGNTSNAAAGSQESTPNYYYSACEMVFFRAAVEQGIALNQPLLDDFEAIKPFLRLEGGGITSPDNLLSDGELFIRNYLLGKAWQQPLMGLAQNFVYIPDDFGSDAQLPVVVEAMGMMGVSFARIPGSPDQNGGTASTPSDGTLAQRIYSGDPVTEREVFVGW